MIIRLVRPDELTTLQELERAAGRCFHEVGMPEIAEDEPLPLDELARYQRAGLAWVAADPAGLVTAPAADLVTDRPAAYLLAERVDGNLHVEQVSVHPDHARRGIGRALLDHLAALATAQGVPALTLTTFAEVPWNAPYYARCGFLPLAGEELGPELREIRARETAHGLDRWPRLAMRRAL